MQEDFTQNRLHPGISMRFETCEVWVQLFKCVSPILSKTMPRFQNVREIFDLIPAYFIPAAAKDSRIRVQVDLSGAEGGQWGVTIQQGCVVVESGALTHPDLTISAPAEDCLAIANGDLNPVVAYMRRRINITGDTACLRELQKMFRLPEQLAWLRNLT